MGTAAHFKEGMKGSKGNGINQSNDFYPSIYKQVFKPSYQKIS